MLIDRRIEQSDLPDWLKDSPVCRINLDGPSAGVEADLQRFLRAFVEPTLGAPTTTPELVGLDNVLDGFGGADKIGALDMGASRTVLSLGTTLDWMGGSLFIRRFTEAARKDTKKHHIRHVQISILGPDSSEHLPARVETNFSDDIATLDLLISPGKEEDRWSEITETTHKKKAASLARDLAAKWRAVESVLNAVASSPPEVKAALAASAEFRKVQTDYAAAAAAIANIPQQNIATSVAAPLALPDKAPVLYRGKKLDGDALEFAAKHYAPWLEARSLDLASLEKLDRKLWNALRNEAYLGGRADEVKALFPSTVEVRDARGDVRPVGELRKIWRQQQSRHRARHREP